MSTTIFPDSVRIAGDITIGGELLPLRPRSSFEQEALAVYPVPIADLRVFDAFQTLLGTPASDDLGITTPDHGTGIPYVSSGDVKNTTATRKLRFEFTLPPEYDPQQTVRVRLAGGMITTIASASATVDVECFLSARDTTKSGSDLCANAAQSINSLTFAELSFDITSSALSPGDTLDVLVTVAVVDSATATAVIAALAHLEMLLDIKG